MPIYLYAAELLNHWLPVIEDHKADFISWEFREAHP
jgi:hypothetical protein